MLNRISRRLNLIYILIHTFFWLAYGTVWAYAAVLLSERGFTGTQIGLAISGATGGSILFEAVLSSLTDKKRMTSRQATIGLMITAATGILLLWAQPAHAFLRILASFILLAAAHNAAAAFVNAMAMEQVARGIALNSGLGRGFGSISYAVANFTIGRLLVRYSSSFVFPLGACLCIGCSCMAALFIDPQERSSAAAEETKEASPVSFWTLLRENPFFTLTLVGCAFLMFGQNVSNTYMIYIARRVGGTEATMGTTLAIGALLEMPAMACVERLRRKHSSLPLFRICALAFAAKQFLLMQATSVPFLYASMLMQFFEFGFFAPVSVFYVQETICAADRTKGQAAMQAAAVGLGCVLAGVTGGSVFDRYGIHAMHMLGFCAAAAGFLIVTISTLCQQRMTKRRETV